MPWMVLRILFGMAHRVDLINQHGDAAVADEWGRPRFPDHPCLVDPSRIAGLRALRDELEMLMRYVILLRHHYAPNLPVPVHYSYRHMRTEWYKDLMILGVEQYEFRRQQQMQQLRWIRHLLRRFFPNKDIVWIRIVEYSVPPKAAGLLVGGAQFHPGPSDEGG